MTMKMITVCTEKNDHFSGIILVSCTVYCSLCEIISITWDWKQKSIYHGYLILCQEHMRSGILPIYNKSIFEH